MCRRRTQMFLRRLTDILRLPRSLLDAGGTKLQMWQSSTLTTRNHFTSCGRYFSLRRTNSQGSYLLVCSKVSWLRTQCKPTLSQAPPARQGWRLCDEFHITPKDSLILRLSTRRARRDGSLAPVRLVFLRYLLFQGECIAQPKGTPSYR